jgi:hypothetical protein
VILKLTAIEKSHRFPHDRFGSFAAQANSGKLKSIAQSSLAAQTASNSHRFLINVQASVVTRASTSIAAAK